MQQYTCGTCGSHNLFARPVSGLWVLACGNDHPYVGQPGDVLQITGEMK